MRIAHLAERPELVPLLALWVYDQWGHLCPDVPYEDFVVSFQRRTEYGRVPESFVALEGDALVGTASIVKYDLSTHKELSPWLAAVYVTPEFRNRGIGSALVRTAMQEAAALGLERLYLITPDKVDFYSRLGWQVLETVAYRGEAVTIMVYQVEAGT